MGHTPIYLEKNNDETNVYALGGDRRSAGRGDV